MGVGGGVRYCIPLSNRQIAIQCSFGISWHKQWPKNTYLAERRKDQPKRSANFTPNLTSQLHSTTCILIDDSKHPTLACKSCNSLHSIAHIQSDIYTFKGDITITGFLLQIKASQFINSRDTVLLTFPARSLGSSRFFSAPAPTVGNWVWNTDTLPPVGLCKGWKINLTVILE